jgi:hypothetical protein
MASARPIRGRHEMAYWTFVQFCAGAAPATVDVVTTS